MTAACTGPIGHECLVAYWANDLDADEVSAIDEHLFGCDPCSAESARIGAFAQGLRSMVPPVITRADVVALQAKGVVLAENEFEPNVRKSAVFERGVQLLIHRLRGLDLTTAQRVSVAIYTETTGAAAPLLEEPQAPFDAGSGEILIACHRHFEAFGDRNVMFDVLVHRAAETTKHTYIVPHVFE